MKEIGSERQHQWKLSLGGAFADRKSMEAGGSEHLGRRQLGRYRVESQAEVDIPRLLLRCEIRVRDGIVEPTGRGNGGRSCATEGSGRIAL